MDQTQKALLELLRDHRFHSGCDLGDHLGVSRAAVSKRVGHLRAVGLEVESQAGKGYRLLSKVEPLDATQIAAQMSLYSAGLMSNLELLEETDSTNLHLLRQSERLRSGSICLAEYQSGGRGRNGRTWVSPWGSNIYLSIFWRYRQGAASLSGLSLALAVMVVDAMQAMGVEGLTIKWPNDVLLDDRKLAGLLVEVQGDASGDLQVIAGVGVNVHLSAGAAEKIDQPWAELANGQRQIPRNQLAGLMIDRLLVGLESFSSGRFSEYSQRWAELDALYGKPVRITGPREPILGTADGVDEFGQLRLKTPEGIKLVAGGEASVRLQ